MAPEAITDPEAVDARTDLYALGAVAYFLLTGDHVFDGKNAAEICGHHLHTVPRPPSAVVGGKPTPLDDLVLACLAKDPDERPQTASEMLERLDACRLPEWSREQADAWWKKHPPSTQKASRQAPSTKTIAVDLAR